MGLDFYCRGLGECMLCIVEDKIKWNAVGDDGIFLECWIRNNNGNKRHFSSG